MPGVDVASVPAVSGKETAQTISDLENLLNNLSIASSPEQANSAAGNLAHFLSGPIPEQTVPLK